jgi:predicted ATPase/class 3 adenylate cyclase
LRNLAIPTGTVVFLFSDIEGSTRRWDAYGEAMRHALRRHDAILRGEIEARRGYVFKTIGDAFCAAFWTIGEALEAAVETQRRLIREDFGEIEGLDVRMAVHAGEADERDGDYFGSAVNRVARLLAVGHGGQILLSGVAAELAAPALPAGAALRHLGTLALRDFKEPEPIYQLNAAELRREFRPLRGLQTPPNNLPSQTTSFVGREDDLAALERLVSRNSVVTIVGAGGIGKTRLALAIAADRLNDELDGAWFVDFASISNADLVVSTVLSALGAEQSSEAPPLDVLVSQLAQRELLLVLDNCEHLLAEVAHVVATIQRRCPRVAVLATSREALDIVPESVYRLDSLPLDAAVRLFAERAAAVDSQFRLETHRSAVEAICRRLDGIALAIELAAARVRSISLSDLSRNLELRILAGGRDRAPRQQTMRALIDWSYDQLTADEQRVLRRCAVCVGGFTLDAARDLCADIADGFRMLETLSSLVGKSLLALDARGRRYRLLEPIREYAFEKLTEASERSEALQHHARTFAAVARAGYAEWESGPAGDWLGRLERELYNFRAALEWSIGDRHELEIGAEIAADTTPLFLRLALLAEGIDWCERVLHVIPALPVAVEARLRYGLSMLYSNQGGNKKVIGQATRAAELFREAGDLPGLTRALSQVAARHAAQCQYSEAQATAREALQLARELGDPRLLAGTLQRCAFASSPDDKETVRALYAESVTLFRSLGRNDETARAFAWWGQWEAESGDFRRAAERLLEGRQLETSELAVMYVSSDIAGCYLAVDDRVGAEPFVREALTLASKVRHPILMPAAISYMAVIASAMDPARAARLAGYAEDRLRAAEWQRVPYEQAIVQNLFDALKGALGEPELRRHLAEGAAWKEEEALAYALSPPVSTV